MTPATATPTKPEPTRLEQLQARRRQLLGWLARQEAMATRAVDHALHELQGAKGFAVQGITMTEWTRASANVSLLTAAIARVDVLISEAEG